MLICKPTPNCASASGSIFPASGGPLCKTHLNKMGLGYRAQAEKRMGPAAALCKCRFHFDYIFRAIIAVHTRARKQRGTGDRPIDRCVALAPTETVSDVINALKPSWVEVIRMV